MGDTVNLRQARKRAERARKDAEAATNRALHGMTKAERVLKDAVTEKNRVALDRAKLDKPEG